METTLYLFYPCKSTHKLLTRLIATALGLLISRDRRGSAGGPALLLGPGLSSWFVLITVSIPEDTPGPGNQEEEEEEEEDEDDEGEEESRTGPRRKRRREDEGGREAAERMERLSSAPEDNPNFISVVIYLIY